MNRDKFDHQLMEYLFDELDEADRAAFTRRLETDAEARELEARLRATLALAQVPLEEPSADLEARILAATSRAESDESWQPKLLRALAWAGSHAMRPQLAMAALMVLVLGSSLLLLRAKPGAMRVTAEAGHPSQAERPAAAVGENAADRQRDPRSSPLPGAASPSLSSNSNDAFTAPIDGNASLERGIALLKDGRAKEARREFSAARAAGGKNAAEASLFEARAARADAGCKEAVVLYDGLRERYGSSGFGADATFEAAQCYRELDEAPKARQLLAELEHNPEYRKRASKELQVGGGATSGRGGLAAPAPPASKAAGAAGAKDSRPAAPQSDSAY